jgi:hypothetical protein
MDPQCKTLKKNQQTPLRFVIRVEVRCMESVEESICLDLDLQQTKSSICSSSRRRRIAAADICLSLLDEAFWGSVLLSSLCQFARDVEIACCNPTRCPTPPLSRKSAAAMQLLLFLLLHPILDQVVCLF